MRREPYFDDPVFDAPDEEFRPLARPKPFRRARLAARFVLAAAAIAGLALIARDGTAPSAAPRAWAEPPQMAESGVRLARLAAAPGPLLAMEGAGPTVKPEPPRWNAATGLREDAVSMGSFDAIEAPYLRVTVTEAPSTPEPGRSLFVTLARRAAEVRGLSVIRTGLRGALATKFGPFETVEATLAGDGSRICTGFASLGAKAVRIDGWLCGVLGQAPDARALACALERLTLATAASPPVEIAFGEAELRRGPGCGKAIGMAGEARIADETGSIAARKNAARVRPSRVTKK